MGLTYPCRCTRADIRAAIVGPAGARRPPSPDGLVYPGTCRGRGMETMGEGDAVRLDLARALDLVGDAGRLA